MMFGRGPRADPHADGAKMVAGPGVAAMNERISPGCCVEHIVAAIAGDGFERAALGKGDVLHQSVGKSAIGGMADHQPAGIAALLRAVHVIDVDQRSVAADRCTRHRHGVELSPVRCVQIEIALAPADRDVIGRAGGVIAAVAKVGRREDAVPVDPLGAGGQDEAGVEAVGLDIDGHAVVGRAPVGVGAPQAADLARGKDEAQEQGQPGEQGAGEFHCTPSFPRTRESRLRSTLEKKRDPRLRGGDGVGQKKEDASPAFRLSPENGLGSRGL
tara:strand:+ start:7691 stop:8506 length:816 start_codon:yes stop_codon:yes gene_type:complete